MFKGAFSAFLFFKVGAAFALLSLFLIYWQSQYYHQQPPFPHRTISKVAQHYPEFLSFRLGTITGASLIVLGWLTNYFMLRTVSVEHGIDLNKYNAKIPLGAGIMGGLLLMVNTATIDTGHMNQQLHEICAASFFIITIFAQVFNSVIVFDLQKRTQAFSQANIYLKYVILSLFIPQIIGDFAVTVNDDKGNFFQWTLTATVISMFISIGLDNNRFEFVYTQTKHSDLQY